MQFFPGEWRGMPGQNNVPSFENGKCVFDAPVTIEDFINKFSVTYGKGFFILKGSFQERANYHIRTSVGTDMGICATINPVVSSKRRLFRVNLFSFRSTSIPLEVRTQR